MSTSAKLTVIPNPFGAPIMQTIIIELTGDAHDAHWLLTKLKQAGLRDLISEAGGGHIKTYTQEPDIPSRNLLQSPSKSESIADI